MSPEVAWKATLGELELQMTKAVFNTWLKGAELVAVDQNQSKYTVSVQTAYARDFLQNRLQDTVKRTLSSVTNSTTDVEFIVGAAQSKPVGAAASSAPVRRAAPRRKRTVVQPSTPARQLTSDSQFNTRYTFATFVVGHNNRLAHAAALAVAEAPGQTYNPLFIYGGVGLGKTHLLQAVGHKSLEAGLSVCYVSSETFTNDLIQSIRKQKTAEFRAKYRSPDVLLIDDIQFIAGKESTQEELFHTFNDLHSRGKQVILSSDRQPRAMVTLEERLRSRFEWGLMADIQLPDQETRVAILQSKAEEKNVTVPRGVLNLIAHHVRSNIRELEGALNKVLAYSQLTGAPISTDMVNMALADYMRLPEKVTVQQVINEVSKYYSVTEDKMIGRGRSRGIVYPRQIAMYLCRTETDASFPQIGQSLGKRDHTTIMHGYEKIAGRIDTDTNLRRDVLEIKASLYDSSY